MGSTPGLRVGLFVTCLVDLIRPRIGFAALTLLEAAGGGGVFARTALYFPFNGVVTTKEV